MTTPEEDPAIGAALALLTLVTGDDWDRAKLLEQSGSLQAIATHTLRKQGLTESDAETFVQSRWEAYAADIPADPAAASEPVDPSPSTQREGDRSPTANLEANNGGIPTVEELRDRLADYKVRKGLVTQEDPAPTEGTGSPGEPAS